EALAKVYISQVRNGLIDISELEKEPSGGKFTLEETAKILALGILRAEEIKARGEKVTEVADKLSSKKGQKGALSWAVTLGLHTFLISGSRTVVEEVVDVMYFWLKAKETIANGGKPQFDELFAAMNHQDLTVRVSAFIVFWDLLGRLEAQGEDVSVPAEFSEVKEAKTKHAIAAGAADYEELEAMSSQGGSIGFLAKYYLRNLKSGSLTDDEIKAKLSDSRPGIATAALIAMTSLTLGGEFSLFEMPGAAQAATAPAAGGAASETAAAVVPVGISLDEMKKTAMKLLAHTDLDISDTGARLLALVYRLQIPSGKVTVKEITDLFLDDPSMHKYRHLGYQLLRDILMPQAEKGTLDQETIQRVMRERKYDEDHARLVELRSDLYVIMHLRHGFDLQTVHDSNDRAMAKNKVGTAKLQRQTSLAADQKATNRFIIQRALRDGTYTDMINERLGSDAEEAGTISRLNEIARNMVLNGEMGLNLPLGDPAAALLARIYQIAYQNGRISKKDLVSFLELNSTDIRRGAAMWALSRENQLPANFEQMVYNAKTDLEFDALAFEWSKTMMNGRKRHGKTFKEKQASGSLDRVDYLAYGYAVARGIADGTVTTAAEELAGDIFLLNALDNSFDSIYIAAAAKSLSRMLAQLVISGRMPLDRLIELAGDKTSNRRRNAAAQALVLVLQEKRTQAALTATAVMASVPVVPLDTVKTINEAGKEFLASVDLETGNSGLRLLYLVYRERLKTQEVSTEEIRNLFLESTSILELQLLGYALIRDILLPKARNGELDIEAVEKEFPETKAVQKSSEGQRRVGQLKSDVLAVLVDEQGASAKDISAMWTRDITKAKVILRQMDRGVLSQAAVDGLVREVSVSQPDQNKLAAVASYLVQRAVRNGSNVGHINEWMESNSVLSSALDFALEEASRNGAGTGEAGLRTPLTDPRAEMLARIYYAAYVNKTITQSELVSYLDLDPGNIQRAAAMWALSRSGYQFQSLNQMVAAAKTDIEFDALAYAWAQVIKNGGRRGKNTFVERKNQGVLDRVDWLAYGYYYQEGIKNGTITKFSPVMEKDGMKFFRVGLKHSDPKVQAAAHQAMSRVLAQLVVRGQITLEELYGLTSAAESWPVRRAAVDAYLLVIQDLPRVQKPAAQPAPATPTGASMSDVQRQQLEQEADEVQRQLNELRAAWAAQQAAEAAAKNTAAGLAPASGQSYDWRKENLEALDGSLHVLRSQQNDGFSAQKVAALSVLIGKVWAERMIKGSLYAGDVNKGLSSTVSGLARLESAAAFAYYYAEKLKSDPVVFKKTVESFLAQVDGLNQRPDSVTLVDAMTGAQSPNTFLPPDVWNSALVDPLTVIFDAGIRVVFPASPVFLTARLQSIAQRGTLPPGVSLEDLEPDLKMIYEKSPSLYKVASKAMGKILFEALGRKVRFADWLSRAQSKEELRAAFIEVIRLYSLENTTAITVVLERRARDFDESWALPAIEALGDIYSMKEEKGIPYQNKLFEINQTKTSPSKELKAALVNAEIKVNLGKIRHGESLMLHFIPESDPATAALAAEKVIRGMATKQSLIEQVNGLPTVPVYLIALGMVVLDEVKKGNDPDPEDLKLFEVERDSGIPDRKEWGGRILAAIDAELVQQGKKKLSDVPQDELSIVLPILINGKETSILLDAAMLSEKLIDPVLAEQRAVLEKMIRVKQLLEGEPPQKPKEAPAQVAPPVDVFAQVRPLVEKMLTPPAAGMLAPEIVRDAADLMKAVLFRHPPKTIEEARALHEFIEQHFIAGKRGRDQIPGYELVTDLAIRRIRMGEAMDGKAVEDVFKERTELEEDDAVDGRRLKGSVYGELVIQGKMTAADIDALPLTVVKEEAHALIMVNAVPTDTALAFAEQRLRNGTIDQITRQALAYYHVKSSMEDGNDVDLIIDMFCRSEATVEAIKRALRWAAEELRMQNKLPASMVENPVRDALVYFYQLALTKKNDLSWIEALATRARNEDVRSAALRTLAYHSNVEDKTEFVRNNIQIESANDYDLETLGILRAVESFFKGLSIDPVINDMRLKSGAHQRYAFVAYAYYLFLKIINKQPVTEKELNNFLGTTDSSLA
ncbi:MAG TPA: hypothetical protein VLJ10_01545, partial [Candidatus Bathyarchaeia archaeon]|nr:hypothetical protein [Candidatus Bathyarchaeia archaeon]